MKTAISILIPYLAAALFLVCPAQAQLINNPGFENFEGNVNDEIGDNFEQWIETFSVGRVEATTEKYSGSYAAKIVGTESQDNEKLNIPWINYSVTLAANTTYHISWYGKTDGGTGTLELSIWYRSGDKKITIPGSLSPQVSLGASHTAWTQKNFVFITPNIETTYCITFRNSGGPGAFSFLDDVHLEAFRGDFEQIHRGSADDETTDNFKLWTEVPQKGIVEITTEKRSGRYAAKFHGGTDDNHPWIIYKCILASGIPYRIRWYGKTDGGAGNIEPAIWYYSNDDKIQIMLPGTYNPQLTIGTSHTDWTEKSFIFTAPVTTNYFIGFRNSGGSGAISYLDDVELSLFNGSFEVFNGIADDTLKDDFKQWNEVRQEGMIEATTDSHSGHYATKITDGAPDNDPWLIYKTLLPANSAYHLRWYGKTDGGSGNLEPAIWYYRDGVQIILPTSDDPKLTLDAAHTDWTYRELFFTPPETALYSIGFRNSGGHGATSFLDDVRLIPTNFQLSEMDDFLYMSYFKLTLGELVASDIDALNASPYTGYGRAITGAYATHVPTFEILEPIRDLIKNKINPGKSIWPWIFLNRIIGAKYSLDIPEYFKFKGMDLWDEHGTLSDFYKLFETALKIAKDTGAPGIVIDPESYHDYDVYSISYLAKRMNRTEKELESQLLAIGRRLADDTQAYYPTATIWLLFYIYPTSAKRSVDYIFHGMLERIKERNYPIKVVAGGEVMIHYLHFNQESLSDRLIKQANDFEGYLKEHPNLKLGATIAPYENIEETDDWMKRMYHHYMSKGGTVRIKVIEDFLPLFDALFKSRRHVWIYGAIHAPYCEYDPNQAQIFHKVIEDAFNN